MAFVKRNPLDLIDWMGRLVVGRIIMVLEVLSLGYNAVKAAFVERYRGRRVIRRIVANQIRFTGMDATYRLCMTGLTLGMVVIFQVTSFMPGSATGEMINRAVGTIMVRELSPLIIALFLIGRSGTAIATELANMKLNKEIDALEAMGINIFHYIVFPRMTGFVVSFAVLLVYFNLVSLYGGNLVLNFLGTVPKSFDVNSVVLELPAYDLFITILKGIIFGYVIATISIYQGLSVKASFREVPIVATRAVVTSIVVCFGANSLISIFLSRSIT